MEKYDEINCFCNHDPRHDWCITPAPKFGKRFKPIEFKQTGYDEGEGYAPVSLFEVEWLGISEWDIFDDFDGSDSKEFTEDVLEKFYKLVESNDPKVQEYIV